VRALPRHHIPGGVLEGADGVRGPAWRGDVERAGAGGADGGLHRLPAGLPGLAVPQLPLRALQAPQLAAHPLAS
jgi:hypothetical protein